MWRICSLTVSLEYHAAITSKHVSIFPGLVTSDLVLCDFWMPFFYRWTFRSSWCTCRQTQREIGHFAWGVRWHPSVDTGVRHWKAEVMLVNGGVFQWTQGFGRQLTQEAQWQGTSMAKVMWADSVVLKWTQVLGHRRRSRVMDAIGFVGSWWSPLMDVHRTSVESDNRRQKSFGWRRSP